jgi:hypothetical protein
VVERRHVAQGAPAGVAEQGGACASAGAAVEARRAKGASARIVSSI